DAFLNKVYVPIRTSQVAVPAGQNPATVCHSGNDVFGNPGVDANGCIAVYHARNDFDDLRPQTGTGQGENEGETGQGEKGQGNGKGQGAGNGNGGGNGNGNGDN